MGSQLSPTRLYSHDQRLRFFCTFPNDREIKNN